MVFFQNGLTPSPLLFLELSSHLLELLSHFFQKSLTKNTSNSITQKLDISIRDIYYLPIFLQIDEYLVFHEMLHFILPVIKATFFVDMETLTMEIYVLFEAK